MNRTAWILLACVLLPVGVAYALLAGSMLVSWFAARSRRADSRRDQGPGGRAPDQG